MKYVLLILISLTALVGCSKKDDPAPAKPKVTAQYDGNLFKENAGIVSEDFQLTLLSDSSYALITNIQPTYGAQGSEYLFSAKGTYSISGTTLSLSQKATIVILERKYADGGENSQPENTTNLVEWFPISYVRSGNNLESVKGNATGFYVVASK